MIERPQFVQVDLSRHRTQMVDLHAEYMEWAAKEIAALLKIEVTAIINMSVRDYISSTIDKICGDLPPKGVHYLLQSQDMIIGMGGLRQISENVGELKRIYIRPEYRGNGLGKILVQKLLENAKEFGYQSVNLDTAIFMREAQQLYYSLGFVDRDVYTEAETPPELRPYAIYMEKTL